MHSLDKITLILHLSDLCNLRCKYCYVQDDHTLKKNLNILMIIPAIKKIINSNADQGTKIILHGGEPLMVSSKKMDKFLALLTTYAGQLGYHLVFSMQTNGTLINDDWIHIFKKYKVRIGMSLDGCNEEQNAYRIDKNGKSVFNRVLERLEFLRQNNLNPGIIFTLNKNHIGKEIELLDFIQEKKIKCNIRPAFPTKGNMLNQNICMTPEEYSWFFCNMFDIWFNGEEKYETFYIRDFEDIVRKILGGSKECHSCVDSDDCSKHFISMGISGDCYPCNRLYNDPQFYLGNLIKLPIEKIMDKSYGLTEKRSEELLYCKSCSIKDFCNGGCPAIAYSVYNNYYEKDYFCKAYQYIYTHVKNILKNYG